MSAAGILSRRSGASHALPEKAVHLNGLADQAVFERLLDSHGQHGAVCGEAQDVRIVAESRAVPAKSIPLPRDVTGGGIAPVGFGLGALEGLEKLKDKKN